MCCATQMCVAAQNACRTPVCAAQTLMPTSVHAQWRHRRGTKNGSRGVAPFPLGTHCNPCEGRSSHERQAQYRSHRRRLDVVPRHPQGPHQASRYLPAESRVPLRHRRGAPGAHRRVRQDPVCRGGARGRVHLHHRQGRRLHRHRLRPVPDSHRRLRDA